MTTSIVSVDSTTSKLQVGGVDAFQFKPNGVMESIASINGGYLYGNRVINGAMEIDQVNNGAAVTPSSTGSTAQLTDMFGASITQASKLTFQQVADAPAGLKKSLKITVAAQYAPVATDQFSLSTAIEGKDLIDFQMGTSGAATFTTSQWIKGSVAGTYAVALRNASVNRSYVGTVTVTTAWTPLKITVTGDLTGTWATDNTVGMFISWDLGSGTNFNTTAGAWQAGNFLRTAGSVTFVNQVAGSTLNITGVDCRLGSTAPAVFERRANELQLAQRYLELISTSGLTGLTAYSPNTAIARTGGLFKVTKRAAPTGSGLIAGVSVNNASANTGASSLSFSASATGFAMDVSVAGTPFTAGQGASVGIADSSLVLFAARLF